MSHYDSPVVRLTTGFIDTINDTVIGGKPAFGTSITDSMVAGQLGQGFWLDDSALQWSSATPGFGGHFRYVKLNASAVAVVRGQLVFWSTIAVAANNLYEVTTLESGTTDTAMNHAGIVLNPGWSAGKYSVIQDVGLVYTKFRTTLTSAGAIGSRVYAAAAGGADLGLADVIDSANPTLFSDVSKMMGRFLGVAQDAPTNGGLKRVYIDINRLRG
jgi:hypothetical protein